MVKRMAALVLLALATCAALAACTLEREPERSESLPQSWELMRDLKASGWEPPYFEGTVRTFPDGHHLDLARRALAHPTESLTVGGFAYRTSPELIAAGREIWRNYHYGSHLYWDFRRAIDHATGIAKPEGYERVYGVKRDAEGYFVGIVGVKRANGDVEYGHSCALCHSNVADDRTIVDGMANQDYDIGLYYDALRPRISDPEVIGLGDSALDVLRFSGPGRTDSTVDSHWAPMRVPHLYALRAFEHGVRANGDMPNLWIQCYRNLNAAYAVDSEIMEAVMAYMLALKPPANPRSQGEREQRGQAVFEAQRCQRCHLPPYYTNGQVVDWSVIRTDTDRIHNGFPKGYKVASLLRLDQYRLYLHDGSLTDLDQLFDPTRLQPSYEAPGIPPGRRKQGAGVPGHMFGMRLSPDDRAALVAYLQSL